MAAVMVTARQRVTPRHWVDDRPVIHRLQRCHGEIEQEGGLDAVVTAVEAERLNPRPQEKTVVKEADRGW